MKSTGGVILFLVLEFLSAASSTSSESYAEYNDEFGDIFAAYYTTDGDGTCGEYGYQFEGDLILSKEQMGYMKYGAKNGISSEDFRWPYGMVFYKFHNGHFRSTEKDIVINAMKLIEDISCVRFYEDHDFKNQYLNISSNGCTCFSEVGYSGRMQYMNIGNDTECLKQGNILHQLLHVLGFYHQHNAPNRDSYLTIQIHNVLERHEDKFHKYNSSFVTDFGVPYDYGSIMHFNSTAYSRNADPTIVPKLNESATIGQRNAMSKKDILKLNLMYKCPIRAENITEFIKELCEKYNKVSYSIW